MDYFTERIQELLDEGNDSEAIRRCVHALMGVRGTEKEENRTIKEKVIEMVQNDGLRERILDDLEDRYRRGKSIFFGPIYELYKFESYAFGDVSLRTLEGLYAFYKCRDDRMTTIGLSQTLLEQYEKEGRDDLIEEAQKRVDENIQLLRERAAHYQETGEHRYAFNSYRYLLGYDFDGPTDDRVLLHVDVLDQRIIADLDISRNFYPKPVPGYKRDTTYPPVVKVPRCPTCKQELRN